MPDNKPISAPDLCPRCGAYWECECEDAPLPPQELLDGVARLREEGRELRRGIEKKMQELQGTEPPDTYNWSLNPLTRYIDEDDA